MSLKENDNKLLLTEDDLQNYAGGGFEIPMTYMECLNCDAWARIDGDYEGQFLDCPKCNGKGTFKGISYLGKKQ